MGCVPIVIRPASHNDMPGVAQLFRTCFADSFAGNPGAIKVKDQALVNIFSFILQEEPDAFRVAIVRDRTVAYCITPRSMRRLWRRAIVGGYVLRWVCNWLLGRYGLSAVAAILIIVDKATFALSPHNYRASDAQILSIGVAPEYRSQGIGYELLKRGLDYLIRMKSKEIKLEVRPNNLAAQKVYRKLGFTVVGKAPDRRGGWLVMRRELVESNLDHQ